MGILRKVARRLRNSASDFQTRMTIRAVTRMVQQGQDTAWLAPLIQPAVLRMVRSGQDIGWLAPIIREMAVSGRGTDDCLRQQCLPVPVHYFSPIPDLADLDERGVWDRRSHLAGIDFHPDAQLEFLAEVARNYGAECNWSPAPTEEKSRFHTENSSFSFGCAAGTHCIIRRFKPRRLLEIGSGNSSKAIGAAMSLNAADTPANPPEYTIVDPYPHDYVEHGLPGLTRLHKQRVELLDVDFFLQLEADDILFIDSGHSVRTGSDLNFLLLDVLPRLNSGVFIHFHDINLPYEYPRKYAVNPTFRQFWTESYLLQAFLSFNSDFEVLLAMQYLFTEHAAAFRAAFPHFDPDRHCSIPVSFWIRRKPSG